MRRYLRETLSLPRVLLNPLRRARTGPDIGHGRPALVIPGLTTGDISTTLLRRTLKARGFVPEGWGLGINTGADPARLKRLEALIAALHRQHGKPVLLIGWSLGGLYARVLAHRIPQHLAMVVTVASPFAGDRRANNAWKVYEALNDHSVYDAPFGEDIEVKPPVPTIAVWSAVDGIVAPECCCGEDHMSDHRLRIDAPHFAIGTSRRAIERIVAKIAEVEALAN
ncbi:alpha/beta hydrolase [Aurantiacibacter arachoides]|nr:alpha/beta hydrolase [Aurantiacibacter arachoides]